MIASGRDQSIEWSASTITTVGYGDVVPVTPWGKFFASITALAGVGLIAMPTGILAAAFSDAFQRSRRDAADFAPGNPTDGSHDLPAHDQ